MKVFVIDVARCNGCYSCQIVCKDEHVGNDWAPYAKPQPDTGQFWLKQNEFVRGSVPKVKMYYQPVLCMHCDNAPCMAACKIEDAIYRRKDGLIIIDPVRCTGCKSCVDACPYKAIYFNEDLNIAQKCTGCAHLLDSDWKVPRCADACPTETLKFGEESEFADQIRQAETMLPELGAKPRVYYLNIPKKFISGTIYDPVEKEVVEEATCTLTEIKTGKKYTATTDGFGDFWFERLGVGTFSLNIEKDGKTKKIDSISTGKDVNLGDIPLI
jgi:tetrathionate reductase subunit B